MKDIFKNTLFNHGYLVHENSEKPNDEFNIRFTLAHLFNINIVSGGEMLTEEMIPYVSRRIGINVSEPFYRGFPQSVRKLSPNKYLFDQLLHYTKTYGYGIFEEPGHSIFEDYIERSVFDEKIPIEKFRVISEKEAEEKIATLVENLTAGSRPINDDQFQLIVSYITEYDYEIKHCNSKNLAVKLLLELRDEKYARFLQLSDVIKLVDELNYTTYGNENLKKLNLNNQDRVFITKIINKNFEKGNCDIRTCYEKKAIWNGLLHHIHYKPVNSEAEEFVQCMRRKGNLSVNAEFERAMAEHDIRRAVSILKKEKGSGALLRNLEYIASRCVSIEDINYIVENIDSSNSIILLQLFIKYSSASTNSARTFKFTRHNMLNVHYETEAEARSRRTILEKSTTEMLKTVLEEKLKCAYAGKLGKVYIDPASENIALPVQETTSSSGIGVLPKGSRLHIEKGKKVRGFTYWEKVDDIDLSVIGINKNNQQCEFSWRSMYCNQSDAITYSGDQTSGYYGGSEFFDINTEKFKTMYPDMEYLVFCNNVYSGRRFSECLCQAGYMLRDIDDSGEVFEPKTVKTSFTINCDSTFAYLFAIDLKANDFIWLNIANNSTSRIAGCNSLDFLKDYLHIAEVMNLSKFFSMLATEVVDNFENADVVVTDKEIETKEGVEVIRSYDFERIIALMNS